MHCSYYKIGCINVYVELHLPPRSNQNGSTHVFIFHSLLSCLAFWGLIKGINLPQQLGNCGHYEGKIPYETSLELWPLKT